MEDEAIIELYWSRSERAIAETSAKYGRYCHAIAYNILNNHQDSEECVNDMYLKLWEAIPPERPGRFLAFLGRIVRNLALNRQAQHCAQKRGGGQVEMALEELAECVPSAHNVERVIEEKELGERINIFLSTLPEETRRLFLRRYWYLSPISEMAVAYGMTESRVKVTLFRTRNKLKEFLVKEGIVL